jgi:hypothetical protein
MIITCTILHSQQRRRTIKKYACKRYLGMTCAELREANELRTKMQTLTLLDSVMDNGNEKNTVIVQSWKHYTFFECLRAVFVQSVLYLEPLHYLEQKIRQFFR